MKKSFLYTILILTAVACTSSRKFKQGDIIFQQGVSSEVESAISGVTRSIDNYNFTHMGIVYIASTDSVFVLEATPPLVKLTPIDEFLYPNKENSKNPLWVAGRLKQEYSHLIEPALEYGITLTGKGYDYGFVLDNDKYYCSELVYKIFRVANGGVELFPLNTMTFCAPGDTTTLESWVKYFDEHSLPIPEGKLGINPGSMSRSDIIELINTK